MKAILLATTALAGFFVFRAVAGKRSGPVAPSGPPAREIAYINRRFVLNPVYFENRSFSSLWSRWCLTQRQSAIVHGSWLMRASNAATRQVRSSAVGWQ